MLYTVNNTTHWLNVSELYTAATRRLLFGSDQLQFQPTHLPSCVKFSLAFSLSFCTSSKKVLQLNQNYYFPDISQLIIH